MSFGLLAVGVHHDEAVAKVGEDRAEETPGLGPAEGDAVVVAVGAHPRQLGGGLGVGHHHDLERGEEGLVQGSRVGIHGHVRVELSHSMHAGLFHNRA